MSLYFKGKKVSATLGSVGVTDHRELTGREAAKQHPIAAIDGLEEELERIPAPAEPLTNEELEEIFK